MSDNPATPDHVTLPKAAADQGLAAIALLNKLTGDPKVGRQAKEAIRAVNPNARFPDLEIEDRVNTLVEERVSRAEKAAADAAAALEADRRQRAEERAESELARRIDSVRGKYRFTEDTMQKVFDRMKAENNPDIEAAAAFVNEGIPKPGPKPADNLLPQGLDLFGMQSKPDDLKPLHDNPMGWFDREVRAVLNDPALA